MTNQDSPTLPQDAPASRAAAPPRILVVDDAAVVRLYYRRILEAAGFAVDEAMNGIEGLERVLATPYALLIVDVNMPRMDGYAFLRQLRREDGAGAVPALMTSTEAKPEDRMAALRAGANMYLVKPVAPQDLLDHVALMAGPAVR
jgi:two-component system chemotaxis response regulator CheY